MSISPRQSRAVAMSARTPSSLAASPGAGNPPISRATAVAASKFRSLTTTRPPAAASPRATARPIPAPAPVTTTPAPSTGIDRHVRRLSRPLLAVTGRRAQAEAGARGILAAGGSGRLWVRGQSCKLTGCMAVIDGESFLPEASGPRARGKGCHVRWVAFTARPAQPAVPQTASSTPPGRDDGESSCPQRCRTAIVRELGLPVGRVDSPLRPGQQYHDSWRNAAWTRVRSPRCTVPSGPMSC